MSATHRLAARFAIVDADGGFDAETGDRLYWSNDHGWVAHGYDHFTPDEVLTLTLPQDGAWVPVPD
jgi:hypothetical protein